MSDFKLIEDDTYYKEVEVITEEGKFVGGVVYPPVSTITHEAFSGLYEPYRYGTTSFSLPEGIGSNSVRILYTDEVLRVSSDLRTSVDDYDIVFFDEQKMSGYKVESAEEWTRNGSFSLLTEYPFVYMCIRIENN